MFTAVVKVATPCSTARITAVVVMVALIWLYTRRAGVKTLVWSDTFQTTCMLAALVLIIVAAMGNLNLHFHGVVAKGAGRPQRVAAAGQNELTG